MQTAGNSENFQLASDDAYEGRCCEVFFTRKRQMIFHCSLCDDNKYGSFAGFREHLTRQHTNDWPTAAEPAEDEDSAIAIEHAKVEKRTIPVAVACKEVFEEYEILEDEESIANKEKMEKPVWEDEDERVESAEFAQETLEITPQPQMCIPQANVLTAVNVHESASNTSQDNSQDSSSSPSRKRKRLTKKATSAAAPGDERHHKCEHCGFAFKQLFNLRAHLRRHTDPKPFGCTQCSKQFHSRSELETHMRRHTGEKPYVCTQCDAAYVSSGALSEHNKRHSNHRPHACPHCPKSFYDTFQLSEHVVAHKPQRNHICELCRATFQRRKSLVGHMKLHTNAREYACALCPAAFNQYQALTIHVKHKHKDSSQDTVRGDDSSGSDVAADAAPLVEGITTCFHCQIEFPDVSALLAHEEQLHAHAAEELVSDTDEKFVITEQLGDVASKSLLV